VFSFSFYNVYVNVLAMLILEVVKLTCFGLGQDGLDNISGIYNYARMVIQ